MSELATTEKKNNDNSSTVATISIQKNKAYSREEIVKVCMEYFNGDELATEVWINKYCMKDSQGNLYEENPDDMHMRMAREFYRIENKYSIDLNGQTKNLSEYGKKREKLTQEKIFKYFERFKYIIPQGSVMSVLGNPFVIGSLSNCIVLPELYDSYGGILFADQQLVQLMKRRCGVGCDLSTLRPEHSSVTNSAGSSTGAISFMERFSSTTREVAQNGRRGALMLTMDINHPDIEKFTTIKSDLSKVTGANISIRLSDEFMFAVKKDKDYVLKFPINSETPTYSKTIKAKELWNTIVSSARNTAEPGLIFWDRQHKYSTSSIYPQYKNISTNPCLTDDTWILTDKGAFQVKSLIGNQFTAIIDGKKYDSTDEGFFCTGKKKIYEIITNEGFSIKVTGNHLIKKISKITRYIKETKWIEAQQLKIGDKINLNNHENFKWDGIGNNENGWLIGSLLGDGTFNQHASILNYWGGNKMDMRKHAIKLIKNNLKYRHGFFGEGNVNAVEILEMDRTTLRSKELYNLAKSLNLNEDKVLHEEIEKTSSDFYAGFLRGWFDADGTVIGNQQSGISVRLCSVILNNLKTAQRMLARMGIISKVYSNRKASGYKSMPDGNGGNKEYLCRAIHELYIGADNIIKYENLIGFTDQSKSNKLKKLIKNYNRTPNRERFVARIKEIKFLGEELVYDCTIPGINEFDANGISVHNCSEISMGNDSCRLIALNMLGCVVNPFTKDAYFDYEKWYEVAYEGQRLMDNLVDLELERIEQILNKIESDPEPAHIKQTEKITWENLYKSGKSGRRTGLGFTAMADALAALGFKYDSNKSLDILEKIMQKKCEAEFDSSIDMAIERGKFDGFDVAIENQSEFIKMLHQELPHVYDRMMKHGRRNVSISTVAPNGSLSVIAQTSSGIEPVFMLSYKRRKKINPNEKHVKVDFVDSIGDKWQEYDVFHPMCKKWMEINGENDFSKSPYFGSTAPEIDWIKRVKMQSIVQKYITHSISSTINLPEDVSVEKVSDIYFKSWELGLKGITIYRDGSRSGVLIAKDEKKENRADFVTHETHAPKRPKVLDAEVIRFVNDGDKWIGFVGLLNGMPYEIFTGKLEHFPIPSYVENGKIKKYKVVIKEDEKINKYDFVFNDKNGDEIIVQGLSESFNSEYWNYAKMISSVLRHGMPLPYVIDLVQSLNLKTESLTTWKTGVIRMIKKYIKDGTKAKDKKCNNCGDDNGVVYEEGCLTCKSCGSSKC